MRSPDFPRQKTHPSELRVLVLGDSVINGGSLTGQEDTVTARLQRSLQRELQRPVIVGNISAGSWGPANLLAYVEAHGWFDADVVVLVLSSHDYADVPTFEPVVGVDPNFPATKPYLALEEGFSRYLLPRLSSRRKDSACAYPAPAAADVETSIGALRQLLETAKQSGADAVLVAQYPERRELAGAMLPGYTVIRETAKSLEVPTFDLREGLAPVGTEEALYIDDIHPSALARDLIARLLHPAVTNALSG